MKTLETLNLSKPVNNLMPSLDKCISIINAKAEYEATYNLPTAKEWQKKNFLKCPWGIAWKVSPARVKTADEALDILVIALVIGWKDLVDQLKRTLKNFGITPNEIDYLKNTVWIPKADEIAKLITDAYKATKPASINEDIVVHNELNPKLFNKDQQLKSEISERIYKLVDLFLEDLSEANIKINIKDIILVGSNVNYNYTKDSDLDIHIIADTKSLSCPDNLYPALYSAYRSLFNKKYNINFYGIPVELYVEEEDTPRVSNGIYSVVQNSWISKPTMPKIPEVNQVAFLEKFKELEAEYKELIKDENLEEEAVINFIEKLYDLRKQGLATEEGEFSIANLLFKEFRNKGYLDNLKELKNEIVSHKLSLESLNLTESQAQEISASYKALSKKYDVDLEELVYGKNGFMETKYPNGFPDFAGDIIYSEKYWNEFIKWANLQDKLAQNLFEDSEAINNLVNIKNKLQKLVGQQVIVNENGIFEIHLIKESDINNIVFRLDRSNLVNNIQVTAGRFDFSKPVLRNNLPSRYYTIIGELNLIN